MHRAILNLILTMIRKGHPLDAVAAPLAELCVMAADPKTGRRTKATGAKVLTMIASAIDDKAP